MYTCLCSKTAGGGLNSNCWFPKQAPSLIIYISDSENNPPPFFDLSLLKNDLGFCLFESSRVKKCTLNTARTPIWLGTMVTFVTRSSSRTEFLVKTLFHNDISDSVLSEIGHFPWNKGRKHAQLEKNLHGVGRSAWVWFSERYRSWRCWATYVFSIHSGDVARPSQSLASTQLHYDAENTK